MSDKLTVVLDGKVHTIPHTMHVLVTNLISMAIDDSFDTVRCSYPASKSKKYTIETVGKRGQGNDLINFDYTAGFETATQATFVSDAISHILNLVEYDKTKPVENLGAADDMLQYGPDNIATTANLLRKWQQAIDTMTQAYAAEMANIKPVE